jgi:hypothetical protein
MGGRHHAKGRFMTRRNGKVQAQSGPSKNAVPGSKRDSKQQRVIGLLQQTEGATIQKLCKAMGWQEHSVRGFLSGTIKKRLGFKLSSVRTKNGERRYRIAGT